MLRDEIDAWLPEVIAAGLVRDIGHELQARIAAMAGGVEPGTRACTELEAQVLLCARERLSAMAMQLAQRAQRGKPGGQPDPDA